MCNIVGRYIYSLYLVVRWLFIFFGWATDLRMIQKTNYFLSKFHFQSLKICCLRALLYTMRINIFIGSTRLLKVIWVLVHSLKMSDFC